MDRGSWQATVHRIARVREDLASKPPWRNWGQLSQRSPAVAPTNAPKKPTVESEEGENETDNRMVKSSQVIQDLWACKSSGPQTTVSVWRPHWDVLKESGNERTLKVILEFNGKPTHNESERRNPKSPWREWLPPDLSEEDKICHHI